MMLPIARQAMLENIGWRRAELIIIGCMRMTTSKQSGDAKSNDARNQREQ